MKLFCFDGVHAFLFTGKQSDDKIEGMFYSCDTWRQEWVAERTENTQLGDVKKLTFLKSDYEKLSFSFPNENGKNVSLNDECYKNKVVIVQIFGT